MGSLSRLGLSCFALLLLVEPALAAKRGESSTAVPTPTEALGVVPEGEVLDRERLLSLLSFLGVQPGSQVVDLGVGIPELATFLAIQVGPEGKLHTVDADSAQLKDLKARPSFPVTRLNAVRSKGEGSGLPAGEIDLVVIADSWRGLKKRGETLERLLPAFSGPGHLVVVDYRSGEIPIGPSASKRTAAEEVVRELEEAGWRFVAESNLLAYRYALVFYPPAREVERPFLTR